MDELDLTPLESAFAQLKKYHAFAVQADDEDFDVFRAAAIQAFEFTYELCIKFIRRGLEIKVGRSFKVDEFSLRDSLRMAGETGLIQDPKKWFEFGDMRNKTSHTYDEKIAMQVFEEVDDLIVSCEFLIGKLENIHVLPE